ncbi:hypothetical protein Tcan_14635 [Toxocara canis]|uniref:Uncharacterized protein n=1 Tax=Toxocara canis TaxID=6265 RepID=A0A0B2V5V0_TOXCA|nr:hypothetical protein Tcan_14635 [Toxocara canis]
MSTTIERFNWIVNLDENAEDQFIEGSDFVQGMMCGFAAKSAVFWDSDCIGVHSCVQRLPSSDESNTQAHLTTMANRPLNKDENTKRESLHSIPKHSSLHKS